jgi:hypothetical protein
MTVTLGLPEFAGIVMPADFVVARSSLEALGASRVASVVWVSMMIVPGSPAAVGGSYLVTGSMMDPGPGYGLMTVILGLWEVGGRVISAFAVVGAGLSELWVSMMIVPGSPGTVAGTYLVTGSVIDPGPG